MHMEAVRALSPHQGTVVTRHLTVWTAAIERHPADAAVLIIGYPEPSGHTIPTLNFHLHDSRVCDLRGLRRRGALTAWHPGDAEGLPASGGGASRPRPLLALAPSPPNHEAPRPSVASAREGIKTTVPRLAPQKERQPPQRTVRKRSSDPRARRPISRRLRPGTPERRGRRRK